MAGQHVLYSCSQQYIVQITCSFISASIFGILIVMSMQSISNAFCLITSGQQLPCEPPNCEIEPPVDEGPGPALPPIQPPPLGPGPVIPPLDEGLGPALPPIQLPPMGPGPVQPPIQIPPMGPGPVQPPHHVLAMDAILRSIILHI